MQTRSEQAIEGRYLLRNLASKFEKVELFDALDTQLDRPVTVQRPTDEAARDPNLSDAFLRHQPIAASIHDPSVMTVYDAGIWEGRPFSVMERFKGAPPSTLHRQGYPPDVPAALSVTRQAADALRFCREQGLTDWAFSPDAVRVNDEGQCCLAIIEGLDGPYASADPSTDSIPLGALLSLILVGNANPAEGGATLTLVPAQVRSLLARMQPGADNPITTAGEVSTAIADIEQDAFQPTEAYDTPEPIAGAATAQDTLLLPEVVPPWDEPTLAAPLPPADPISVPYLPPPQPVRNEAPRPPKWLLLLAASSGLLLLTLLLLAVVSRGVPNRAGAQSSTPTTSSSDTANTAAVPDVLGKTLEEARSAAGAAGLNLAVADPVHDPSAPPDRVARQDPPAPAQLQAGSLITVSLSLGPDPTATTPPAPPAPAQQPAEDQQQQQQPSDQQAPSKKEPPGQKKKNKD